jgi:3-hydroxyacyl-[acyl-carrier-protein] dehydratase
MEVPDDYAVPLLALDQIVSISDVGITTRKVLSSDEPYFMGHFPKFPIFPGIFIVEAVHQAVVYYAVNYFGRVKMIEIRAVRFFSPVVPGDLLECDCQCAAISEELLQVKATCRCGERRVASVNLIYCLEKANDRPQSCRD